MDDMTLSDASPVAHSAVATINTSTAATPRAPRSASESQLQACTGCRVRHLCLPAQFSADAVVRFNNAIPMRRRIERGVRVFQSGETFTSLFAIRVGFFKSYAVSEDGAMQIMRFPMPGDLLGLDGIAAGRHMQTIEALSYSEVCQIPYASVTALASGMPELRDAMDKTLADAINRKQGIVMMLGSMGAEARMAAFLLDLAQRLLVRGYSQRAFVLPMARRDIARYLAVRHETVTRTLMALQRDGVIALSGCRVEILDWKRLQSLRRYGD
jgi:CRP/FNR family transcriptional regulator, anaerobic regulatory protein